MATLKGNMPDVDQNGEIWADLSGRRNRERMDRLLETSP